jgi:hypothetical protein
MQSRRRTIGIATSLLVLGGTTGLWVADHDAATLAAVPPPQWLDSDGDFLPDALEWVLLFDAQDADSDDDGVGDFLEAAQRTLPGDREPAPIDHEARVVVTVAREGGCDTVWVHFLFRFVGTDMTPLRSLEPFADWWSYRLPLNNLLGNGRIDVATRPAGADGLFVRASVEIATATELRTLLPCTIGAVADLDGRSISTGAYLTEADGHLATLVGFDHNALVAQTLCQGDQGSPFWTGNRVCLMRLAVVGLAPGGAVAEVTSATCVADGRLSCPPTCVQATGQMMFFPDGLSTVTGGGVPRR